jgi:MOSC domain-containing protein YiiM
MRLSRKQEYELTRREIPIRIASEKFLASDRTGFYFAVTREGEVGAGDKITTLARDPNAVSVSEIMRLYIAKRFGPDDVASLRRALQVAIFPEPWKDYFRERLQKSSA